MLPNPCFSSFLVRQEGFMDAFKRSTGAELHLGSFTWTSSKEHPGAITTIYIS